jgi:hypothetical protein
MTEFVREGEPLARRRLGAVDEEDPLVAFPKQAPAIAGGRHPTMTGISNRSSTTLRQSSGAVGWSPAAARASRARLAPRLLWRLATR